MPRSTAASKDNHCQVVNESKELNEQDLKHIFQSHLKFYKNNIYPSYEYRAHLLCRLKNGLLQHKDAICNATHQDFGNRSASETLFLEVMQVIDHINHTLRHLKAWMKPEQRLLPIQLMPGSSMVMPQPKGIVGIVSPWNYPTLLSLSPLVTALSAGNTVLMKGSEYTPETNNVLEQLCNEVFNGKNASFIQGDATVAEIFCKLPFDHLFFTGSPSIGKKVMSSAAENLTPVTLELGGKSPVLIDPKYNIAKAAQAVAFGKSLNAGQTCIAPDYVLCPEDKVVGFINEIKKSFLKMYPSQATNEDYTSIISERHFARLQTLLQDAEMKGAEIISITQDNEDFITSRKMPLTLVCKATSDMLILQEEIFGPILPILPISSIDNAIEYIENNAPPLALYLMSDDVATQEKVKIKTHAGGMCINDILIHAASQNLPFGGLRQSGIGCYHGKEGFMELSHRKSVLKRGRWNPTNLIAPPWNRKVHQLLIKWLVR